MATTRSPAEISSSAQQGHLDLVRAVALAANTSWAPGVAFEVALEVICDYTGWPVGIVWDVERRSSGAWLLPGARWSTDGFAEVLEDRLGPTEAAAAGVVGALARTAAPASVWKLATDTADPLGAARSTPTTSAAFAVVVDGQAVAILQFLLEEEAVLDRGIMTAMETVTLQLSRVVERALTEADLRDREMQARQVMDRATDPFVSVELDGLVLEWNRRATEVFGWTSDQVVGNHVSETLVPTELSETFEGLLEGYRLHRTSPLLGRTTRLALRDRTGRSIETEAWIWGSGGRRPRLNAFVRPLEMPEHATAGTAPVVEQRTRSERQPLEQLLDHQLTEDRWGVEIAVLQVDRFWRLRDELGAVACDDVLDQVRRRLEAAVGSEGTVAMLREAQFGVTLTRTVRDSGLLGRQLVDALRRPIEGPGYKVALDANAGLVEAASVTGDAAQLIEHAVAALRTAQQRGPGKVETYDPAVHDRNRDRLWLEADLRDAVSAGQVEVHYQPLVELGSGRLSSCEALVRWRHPRHGLLTPDRFIPEAERTGTIHELGQEILSQAARCAARWRTRATDPHPSVAVNLSPVQLESDLLAGEIDSVLVDNGLQPGDLTLEITESALTVDETLIVGRLWELHELGVTLAMDDFGTGHSSLGRLRALPFDVLKIDRSFLTHVTTTDEDVPLLHAVTNLAHDLGMRVVAEGVETPAQLHAAIRYGCTHAQGYLFSKPVTSSVLDRLLHEPDWDLDG